MSRRQRWLVFTFTCLSLIASAIQIAGDRIGEGWATFRRSVDWIGIRTGSSRVASPADLGGPFAPPGSRADDPQWADLRNGVYAIRLPEFFRAGEEARIQLFLITGADQAVPPGLDLAAAATAPYAPQVRAALKVPEGVELSALRAPTAWTSTRASVLWEWKVTVPYPHSQVPFEIAVLNETSGRHLYSAQIINEVRPTPRSMINYMLVVLASFVSSTFAPITSLVGLAVVVGEGVLLWRRARTNGR
ncbi:hypothetical protein [Prosthecomicrobium pneumaticum]|uniref:7TM-DISM receptor extracellular domain-containing protein n=1 Tax=Prosthecomicrobium pneumaticum TaxID=81895 RepID=A0A7W9L474_9HYPH|nr:hypothetical protein [Prosthecomicrobium pneumaticum]MBB5755286.1 hypothetical protein [Prosthecomicrobium pneumaticum]